MDPGEESMGEQIDDIFRDMYARWSELTRWLMRHFDPDTSEDQKYPMNMPPARDRNHYPRHSSNLGSLEHTLDYTGHFLSPEEEIPGEIVVPIESQDLSLENAHKKELYEGIDGILDIAQGVYASLVAIRMELGAAVKVGLAGVSWRYKDYQILSEHEGKDGAHKNLVAYTAQLINYLILFGDGYDKLEQIFGKEERSIIFQEALTAFRGGRSDNLSAFDKQMFEHLKDKKENILKYTDGLTDVLGGVPEGREGAEPMGGVVPMICQFLRGTIYEDELVGEYGLMLNGMYWLTYDPPLKTGLELLLGKDQKDGGKIRKFHVGKDAKGRDNLREDTYYLLG